MYGSYSSATVNPSHLIQIAVPVSQSENILISSASSTGGSATPGVSSFHYTEYRLLTLLTIAPTEVVFILLDYAKLAHPNQSNTSAHALNNAIGNVFATAKGRQEKKFKKNNI